LCIKSFGASHVPLLFEKQNTIKALIYPTFPVKSHKNAYFKADLFVPLLKQIRL